MRLRRDLKVWQLRQWLQLSTLGIDYSQSNAMRAVGMDSEDDGIIGVHVSEYVEALNRRASLSGGEVEDVRYTYDWAFIDYRLGIGGDPKTLYVCIDHSTRRALGYPVVVTRKTKQLTVEAMAPEHHDYRPEPEPDATDAPGITLTYDQLRGWADVLDFAPGVLERLAAAIPDSTIPDALADIIDGILSRPQP